MEIMNCTLKQQKIVNKIIDHLGIDYVTKYINNFYKVIDMKNLTREQAQKIITGLSHKLSRKPILNVYGRDFY